ncbi:MAG: hypothetical protein HC850_05015 [Rhodomicrobium sp.]|nr:hypothetical protein [Rhodomicrobium sp.]
MAKHTPSDTRSKDDDAIEPYLLNHRDGSLWAKGQTLRGQPTGHWEWFRKDGTKMRSGRFENGEQAGEWTTDDKTGTVYKVTAIKPGTKPKAGKS